METVAGTQAPVLQVGNEVAYDPHKTIYLLTRLLAGVCDGAVTRDNVGFNGAHAQFGRRMAELPWEQWTPRQTWAMYKVLSTYKNTQLQAFWGLAPDIAEPPKPAQGYGRGDDRQFGVFRRLFVAEDGGKLHHSFAGMQALVFESSYDPAIVTAVKGIPGRAYTGPPQKMWLVPLTVESVRMALDVAIEHGFDIHERVAEVVQGKLASLAENIEMSHAMRPEDLVRIDDHGRDLIKRLRACYPGGLALYPFQEAGVAFIAKNRHTLVGDEMGLGKTPQALMAAEVLNAYPMLVVCPATLKANWEDEIIKWLPHRTSLVLSGRRQVFQEDGKTPRADITIVNYDILEQNFMDLTSLQPKMIVCDEAHKLKNMASKRHKNMAMIFAAAPNTLRVLLSGTPVVNRPMELWSLIELLGYAEYMAGQGTAAQRMKRFKYRYDTTYRDRLEELGQRIRERFFIRRLKAMVMTELPPKFRDIIHVELTNRAEYDEAEQHLAAYVAGLAKDGAAFDYEAVLSEALEQGLTIDDIPAYLAQRKTAFEQSIYRKKYDVTARNEALVRWNHLKQLAVRGKMAGVFAWIDEFLENTDQKLVVYVWHVDVGKALAQRYRADFLHGGVPTDKRAPLWKRFQQPDGPRIFVGNMQAAGEGLNLQCASTVAFVEYGWNPKDHEQAEDRCHRDGQHDNVMAWYFAASYTIEDEIAAIIKRKLGVTTAIHDGGGRDAQLEMLDELSRKLYERKSRRQAA